VTRRSARTAKIACCIFAMHGSSPVLAQQRVEVPTLPQLAPVVVQLDGVPTGALVTMLLRDIVRVPYVIAPDVLADRRPMSVRLIIPRGRQLADVVSFLRNNGFGVRNEGGTLYVAKGGGVAPGTFVRDPGRRLQPAPPGRGQPGPRNEAPRTEYVAPNVPFGNPLDPTLGRIVRSEPAAPRDHRQDVHAEPQASVQGSSPATADADTSILGYVPAHRDPAYLATVIGTVLPNVKLGARTEVAGDADRVAISAREGPDVLVIAGSYRDLAKSRQLITLLDRPRPMVAVKAVVLQVSNVKTRGSALSILASFAGGNGGSLGADAPGSQFLRIAVGGVRAIFSAVREDSRFKIVASPNLAALSGAVATINSGSQVPTIGSVTTVDGGAPVQSVVYRDSGITLTVRPVVRGDTVELDVREERSTFVPTTTGVENSPTLQKSSASASVLLKSGESVVLAGLTEKSDERRREGLLGGLLGVRSNGQNESELLVVLTAEIVPSPATAPGTFIDIDGSGAAHPDVSPASA